MIIYCFIGGMFVITRSTGCSDLPGGFKKLISMREFEKCGARTPHHGWYYYLTVRATVPANSNHPSREQKMWIENGRVTLFHNWLFQSRCDNTRERQRSKIDGSMWDGSYIVPHRFRSEWSVQQQKITKLTYWKQLCIHSSSGSERRNELY